MNFQTDFSPFDPGEKLALSLDFSNGDLLPGDSIVSAVWDLDVVAVDTGATQDGSPGSRLTGPATTDPATPQITSHYVQDLQPGNRYRVQATVTTDSGDVVSGYTHVRCLALV